ALERREGHVGRCGLHERADGDQRGTAEQHGQIVGIERMSTRCGHGAPLAAPVRNGDSASCRFISSETAKNTTAENAGAHARPRHAAAVFTPARVTRSSRAVNTPLSTAAAHSPPNRFALRTSGGALENFAAPSA